MRRHENAAGGGALRARIGLGFFCSTSDNKLSTNHGLRLRNLGWKALFKVFERNLRDFFELLELSRGMGLTIFRLGSSFIPFASHPSFRRSWLNKLGRVLREAAPKIKGYGIRITMHPGQFVVLSSPRDEVVERSLAELRYHFWLLDALGIGPEGVVVIHIGGTYGEKDRAVKRFLEVLENNRWLLRRIALENDERHYSISEVIELAEVLGAPAVFDYYHHTLNPSKFNVDKLISTWGGVTPEVHLSSPPSGAHRFGEHGDYVDVTDFKNLISMLGDQPADVILEAKKKEKAVARLLAELGREGMLVDGSPRWGVVP